MGTHQSWTCSSLPTRSTQPVLPAASAHPIQLPRPCPLPDTPRVRAPRPSGRAAGVGWGLQGPLRVGRSQSCEKSRGTVSTVSRERKPQHITKLQKPLDAIVITEGRTVRMLSEAGSAWDLSPGSGKCPPLFSPCQDRVIVFCGEKRLRAQLSFRQLTWIRFSSSTVEKDVWKPQSSSRGS